MSIFNAKHYKAIAQAIDHSRSPAKAQFISAPNLVNLLSYYFKLDNPRFNESTFRTACGEDIRSDQSQTLGLTT